MVVSITLNPYAFFVSGINTEFDGMNINSALMLTTAQVPRSWKIDSVQLKMDCYRYGETQNNIIQS